MIAKRVTRREALAIGLVGAGGLAGCARKDAAAPPVPEAAPEPSSERASWVGMTALPREYETVGLLSITFSQQGGVDSNESAPAPLPFRLGAASYTVKAETEEAVQVCYENGGLILVKHEAFIAVNEAVRYFSTRIVESPRDRFALNSRGWAHYMLGESEKALADFDEFLRLTPAVRTDGSEGPFRWEGLVNRGLVLTEQGKFERALKDLDEAVVLAPECAIAWVNRGWARERMGLYHAAVRDFAQACQIAPTFTLAMNNLAWVLATCPEPERRESQSAIKQARRACEATHNREGMYLDTLAAAYATGWQFDDAMKVQEMALADTSFVARYGADARQRLQMYRARTPFRTAPVNR